MLKYSLAFVFIWFSLLVAGQVNAPLLEREISINLSNTTLATALDKIATQGNVTFSYNPKSINTNKIVNVKATNKSVREVLALVLGDETSYKASGKYIILSKADNTAKKVTVGGYVYDKSSGKKLANTSVYDVNTMTSSISDSYGYYELTVPRKEPKLNLNVKKDEYSDTVVSLTPISNRLVEISIQPAPDVAPYNDSLNRQKFGAKFFTGAKAFINTINIKDTIYRRFQLTLLPYVGTNHKLSANVINKVSINVLGGYSLGTNGLELGGIFNTNRRSVSGFQAAGITNIVGGGAKGFQAGGILNSVHGTVRGFQAGGVLNYDRDTVSGFQAAGVANINCGLVNGFQAAGMFNFNLAPVHGFQAAGFMNINSKEVTGGSAAGFANINVLSHTGFNAAGLFNYSHRHFNGVQIAGLFNYAGSLEKTAQVSGLFNIAARKSGALQLAALINYATELHGVQIGILNVSDTVNGGVSIGLISLVRKGVHQIEISGDELLFTHIGFRTGSRGFHNIFGAGISLKDAQSPLWSFTYGLGTSIKMHKRWNFDIDLTYNHISKGAFNTNVNFLNKLYLGPEFAIGRKIKVAAGPTLNLFLSDSTQPDYAGTFSTLAPYSFTNNTASSNNLNIKWWVGGKVAFRFL